MCQLLKRELRLKYLLLEDINPLSFVESAFQFIPRWVLVMNRSAMAGTCLSTLLYTAIETPVLQFTSRRANDSNGSGSLPESDYCKINGQFFLCYLTVWSYIIILLYFLTALVAMAAVFRHGGIGPAVQQDAFSRSLLQLQWLLLGIGSNAAAIVSVVYWGLLRPAMTTHCVTNMPLSVDLLMHLCNSVFLLIELAISGIIVHPVHCVYTIAYGLVYMLFSLLYWIPDHSRVMYSVILDWNYPALTVCTFLVLALIIVPAVHLLWWLLYLLRSLVSSRHETSSRGHYQRLMES